MRPMRKPREAMAAFSAHELVDGARSLHEARVCPYNVTWSQQAASGGGVGART